MQLLAQVRDAENNSTVHRTSWDAAEQLERIDPYTLRFHLNKLTQTENENGGTINSYIQTTTDQTNTLANNKTYDLTLLINKLRIGMVCLKQTYSTIYLPSNTNTIANGGIPLGSMDEYNQTTITPNTYLELEKGLPIGTNITSLRTLTGDNILPTTTSVGFKVIFGNTMSHEPIPTNITAVIDDGQDPNNHYALLQIVDAEENIIASIPSNGYEQYIESDLTTGEPALRVMCYWGENGSQSEPIDIDVKDLLGNGTAYSIRICCRLQSVTFTRVSDGMLGTYAQIKFLTDGAALQILHDQFAMKAVLPPAPLLADAAPLEPTINAELAYDLPFEPAYSWMNKYDQFTNKFSYQPITKVIETIGEDKTCYVGLYIFGSYDGRKWSLLGGKEKSGVFTDIGCDVEHTDVRFLRYILAGNVKGDSRIDYMEMSHASSVLNTKIR